MREIAPSDAWLAYDETAEWAAKFHEAEQDFIGSDMFHEALWEFTHNENDEANGKTDEEWRKTKDFHDSVISYMEYQEGRRKHLDEY